MKQNLALHLYQEGKIAKSKAAELAGISLWEMMDLIEQAAVPARYSLAEALEEVRQIVAKAAAPPTTQA
jgi:predicted HTH domain antitoxin